MPAKSTTHPSYPTPFMPRPHIAYVRWADCRNMCDTDASVQPHLIPPPTNHAPSPPQCLPSVGDYEDRCADIVRRLQEQVRQRRILVYPYFKDFDRASAYSRVVTKLQFRRVLHFLDLNLAEDDFALIAAKFKEPRSGDIDYPAFVQTIDQGFHYLYSPLISPFPPLTILKPHSKPTLTPSNPTLSSPNPTPTPLYPTLTLL